MANFRLSRKICICLVIVLIFSNSVFAVSISSSVNAQASYTRIGQFNQYITNNYGSQTANADTALLIGMYQSLAKLAAPGVAYGIDRINHSYYLTGTLTYLQEYLMQITENQYDMYKSEDTYLDGLSSVVSDIKTNTTNSAASDLALLQLVGDQVNIDWVNMSISSIEAATSVQNAFDQTYISSAGLVGNDIYIRLDLGSNPNYNSILKFVLPIIPYTSTSDFTLADVYIMNSVNTGWAYIASPGTKLVGNTSNNVSTVYYDGFIRSYAGANISNKILLHIHSNQSIYYLYGNRSQASVSYITTDKVDYHTVYDTYLLEQIRDKEMTADVNVEINDSVNVTPILLDVEIGINDFTEVNTISNKLRTWLSTGVGVSALIGALDQLDDSFFTLHNRNVIETINSGYTDFYD